MSKKTQNLIVVGAFVLLAFAAIIAFQGSPFTIIVPSSQNIQVNTWANPYVTADVDRVFSSSTTAGVGRNLCNARIATAAGPKFIVKYFYRADKGPTSFASFTSTELSQNSAGYYTGTKTLTWPVTNGQCASTFNYNLAPFKVGAIDKFTITVVYYDYYYQNTLVNSEYLNAFTSVAAALPACPVSTTQGITTDCVCGGGTVYGTKYPNYWYCYDGYTHTTPKATPTPVSTASAVPTATPSVVPTPTTTPAPQVCQPSTQTCAGGVLQTCTPSGSGWVATGEICGQPTAQPTSQPSVVPTPTVIIEGCANLPQDYVCGSDNKNYINYCYAQQAGATPFKAGLCTEASNGNAATVGLIAVIGGVLLIGGIAFIIRRK